MTGFADMFKSSFVEESSVLVVNVTVQLVAMATHLYLPDESVRILKF
jgi:hypothetical protein